MKVGKIDNLEVDFIATRSDSMLYVQVTASLTDPATQEMNDRGIKLKNLVDFLLEQ